MFTPPHPQAGAINAFWGTDFELSPKIYLQRNTISTIGKKLVNLQGLPYRSPNFVNFGPQTAENDGEFLPTPIVCAQDELQADICDTFWFNHRPYSPDAAYGRRRCQELG